jgi:hypothetical protein
MRIKSRTVQGGWRCAGAVVGMRGVGVGVAVRVGVIAVPVAIDSPVYQAR